MDSGYKIKNIEYELKYYKKNNFYNNLNFKLLIIISIIFFFVSKLSIFNFKKFNCVQNEI